MEVNTISGREDEKGAALIGALLILIMLTALGMAAIMTSTTETMIGRNDYTAKQVHYAAEAGIQEAMAKIDFTRIVPDPAHYDTWKYDNYSAFRFTDYAGHTQAFMGYSVTVKYKIEGEYGDNIHIHNTANGELVRYNQGFGYASSPVPDPALGQPVYTIRSLGIMYSGGKRSTAEIIVDCSENTLNVYGPASLATNGGLDCNGSYSISGGGTKPGFVTNGPVSVPPPGVVTGTGSPPYQTGAYTDMTGANPYIGANLPELKAMATPPGGEYYLRTGPNSWNPPLGNSPTWGGPTEPKMIFLDEPGQEYHMSGNMVGYGVLVVNGNFKISGSLTWYGLIYVTGNLDAATGTINGQGAIMAGGSAPTKIGGNVNMFYNTTALDNVSKLMFKQKQVGWRKRYN